MKLTLTENLFTNGEYVVAYGLKKAKFTIIDEEYTGASGLVKIDRMICTVRTYDGAGEIVSEVFGSLVIGLGDSNVAVTAQDRALLGTVMTRYNMENCVVELYE